MSWQRLVTWQRSDMATGADTHALPNALDGCSMLAKCGADAPAPEPAAAALTELPVALVRRIVECCDVASACALTATCVALRALQADDRVWEALSTRRYGEALWVLAAQRPSGSARRLGCRRLELLRMLRWERRFEQLYGREWIAADYVALWRWLDGREELHAVLPHMRKLQQLPDCH